MYKRQAKALSSIGIDLYTVRQRVHELVEKEDFDDLETEDVYKRQYISIRKILQQSQKIGKI